MDLKMLLLFPLLCCGAPILILLVPSAVFSAVAAAVGGAAWYLAAVGIGVVGLLFWRFHQRWPVQRGREATDARRQTTADPWGSTRAE